MVMEQPVGEEQKTNKQMNGTTTWGRNILLTLSLEKAASKM